MNITCGTDIIEIDRIRASAENEEFIKRVYTEKEIEYCESKKAVKYQHYAARFAAKEAVFKAISTFLEDKFDIVWKDVEIINDENGKPKVNFLDKRPEELENIDISISHCKLYAVANTVAIWK